MDSNTHTPRTAKFARRALPVFAIAVLTIGLGACQTPRQGEPAPTGHVIDTVQAPAGVDVNRPADRVDEELQRAAAAAKANAERFRGVPADRVEEQLAAEAQAKAAPHFGSGTDGVTAEHFGSGTDGVTAEIEHQVARGHLRME